MTAHTTQLIQLFQYLIGNVIQFCPMELIDNKWLFCVCDYSSIKSKYLKQIFKVLKCLQARQQFIGTGIGLAICQIIDQYYSEQMRAKSTARVGTALYFAFPPLTARVIR